MSDLAASLRRLIRSPAFKFFLISFLILLLLIPMFMVAGLVSEREGRAREVRSEIAKVWGQPQQLFGPFLVVPYTIRIEVREGDKLVERLQERRAVFTPEQLDIKTDAVSKVLHRGIYDAPVFTAKVGVSGRFLKPDIGDVVADAQSVRWRDAILVLGLSDVSGLKEAAVLKITEAIDIPFAPSLGIPLGPSNPLNGIHAKLSGAGPAVLPSPDAAPLPFSFRLDLVFSGSASLQFAPAARETKLFGVADRNG